MVSNRKPEGWVKGGEGSPGREDSIHKCWKAGAACVLCLSFCSFPKHFLRPLVSQALGWAGLSQTWALASGSPRLVEETFTGSCGGHVCDSMGASKQSPEYLEWTSHGKIHSEGIPGSGDDRSKNPEVEMCWHIWGTVQRPVWLEEKGKEDETTEVDREVKGEGPCWWRVQFRIWTQGGINALFHDEP